MPDRELEASVAVGSGADPKIANDIASALSRLLGQSVPVKTLPNVIQSNSGMGPNGEYFHSVDNPLTGGTTVTIEDPVTGEVTVTVHPKRK